MTGGKSAGGLHSLDAVQIEQLMQMKQLLALADPGPLMPSGKRPVEELDDPLWRCSMNAENDETYNWLAKAVNAYGTQAWVACVSYVTPFHLRHRQKAQELSQYPLEMHALLEQLMHAAEMFLGSRFTLGEDAERFAVAPKILKERFDELMRWIAAEELNRLVVSRDWTLWQVGDTSRATVNSERVLETYLKTTTSLLKTSYAWIMKESDQPNLMNWNIYSVSEAWWVL